MQEDARLAEEDASQGSGEHIDADAFCFQRRASTLVSPPRDDSEGESEEGAGFDSVTAGYRDNLQRDVNDANDLGGLQE